MAVTTMPFGKWKGTPLSEVPRGYLHWAIENMTQLYPETKAAIQAVLDGKAPPREPGDESETGITAPARQGRTGKRGGSPSAGKHPAAGEHVLCERCGLAPGSKPMVHLACAESDVPF